jgi:hypothetical protein
MGMCGETKVLKFFSLLKIAIFWDIAPCSPYMNRRFGGTYHFHLQGRKSAEQETSVRVGGRFMYGLHGAISHKTADFITTAVRTSYPTFLFIVLLRLAITYIRRTLDIWHVHYVRTLDIWQHGGN